MQEDKKFESVSEKVDRVIETQVESNEKIDAIYDMLQKQNAKPIATITNDKPTPNVPNANDEAIKRRKVMEYIASTADKKYGYVGTYKQFLIFKYLIIGLFALLGVLCVVNTAIGYALLKGYENISYVDWIFLIYTAVFIYPIFMFNYKTDVTKMLNKSRMEELQILNVSYPQGYMIKKWKIMCIVFPILEALLIIACTYDVANLLPHIIMLCIELVIGITIYVLFTLFVRKYMAIIYDGKIEDKYVGLVYSPMEYGNKVMEMDEYLANNKGKEKYKG